MLSYQHLYHAGNLADVHKHATLAWVLDYLTQKDKPLSYVETHAGRLETLGLSCDRTGPQTVVVRKVPTLLQQADMVAQAGKQPGGADIRFRERSRHIHLRELKPPQQFCHGQVAERAPA